VKALRFALVGCSAIAKKHAESLRRIDGAELAAVCDIDISRAEDLGNAYGVRHYGDYHELLKRETVDVVTVLTQSGDHAARVLDLLPYGKHIVVEKPLALRLEDADAVIRGCDEAGVKLFVVQQNRQNRAIQALRRALDERRFGRLVLGTVRVRWCRRQDYYDAAPWRGTWAQDGGVLTNQASHHIDMLRWMMGDVESVTAMTATRLARIEAEDTAVAMLRFYSGALGVIEATTATRPSALEGSISILGERGSVVVGGFAMDRLETWAFEDQEPYDAAIFETNGRNPDVIAWNHAEYLRSVVESIRSDRRALVDGLEGRRSLELINALYESSESGREVVLRFRARHARLGQAPEA
jgi:predicted dehydrogenase